MTTVVVWAENPHMVFRYHAVLPSTVFYSLCCGLRHLTSLTLLLIISYFVRAGVGINRQPVTRELNYGFFAHFPKA